MKMIMGLSLIALVVVVIGVLIIRLVDSEIKTIEGSAGWYDRDSLKKEGSSGIMANNEPFEDGKMTCASWDFVLGTNLMVTNKNNGSSAVVKVTDRGPSKELRKRGRILDLSKLAFETISDLSIGVIPVKVTELED